MMIRRSPTDDQLLVFLKANGGYATPKEIRANLPHSKRGIDNAITGLSYRGEVALVTEMRVNKQYTVYVCLPHLKQSLEESLDLGKTALKILKAEGGICRQERLLEKLRKASPIGLSRGRFVHLLAHLISTGEVGEVHPTSKAAMVYLPGKREEAEAEVYRSPKREKLLQLVGMGPVTTTKLDTALRTDFMLRDLYLEKDPARRVHSRRFKRRARGSPAKVVFLERDVHVVDMIGKSPDAILELVHSFIAKHEFVYLGDIKVRGVARDAVPAVLIDLELCNRLEMRFVEIGGEVRKAYCIPENLAKVERLARKRHVKLL